MSISITGRTWGEMYGEHIKERYKGKVWKLAVNSKVDADALQVMVEFRIPVGEADELEMYKRINRVIEVIAEGD